jgi:hypothetical protein
MANTAGVQASIGNGQTLNADAARYWLALVAVIYRLHGIVIDPTEGTRTKERQGYLYANRNRPGFNPAWPADSPFAYHVSGRAVDVGSGVGYLATIASQVFYAMAGLYGFRPTVKGEPWHFEWRAEWVGISLEVAAVVQRIIPTNPTTTKGDTMIHLKGSGKRGEALIGPGYYHSLTGEEAKYVSLVADREVDCRNNDRLFDVLATAASTPSKRP